LRLYSEGGIGQIWVAHDQSLGREVALKELKPERADQESIRARFVDEARITGQLEHPGVVPVYQLVNATNEHPAYYTMRLVRGRNLADAIQAYHRQRQASRAGPLALRALLTNYITICNTVAYAHARGVLHRDLKPQNIVLGDFGEVVVLDWGLAKLMGHNETRDTMAPLSIETDMSRGQTMTGQVLGTPSYLAPEQAEGRLDLLDERADVYGLGAILLEILTGEPPFFGKNATETLRRVVHEPLILPRHRVDGVPAPLEAVCVKALSKSPSERYGSALEVAREIEHFLADEPVSAWPEPLWLRARRWLARHRAVAAATAATVLAATLTLGVSTVRLSAANERERQAREREREARLRAEESFTLAKEAVDRGFTRVSEADQLKALGLEKLRKDLLGQAKDFYEHLVNQASDQPALQAERGRSYLRLAEITGELGNRQQAISFVQEAHALFEELSRAHPNDVEFVDGSASSLEALGDSYYETSQMQKAREADERALMLRESLARQRSGSTNERFRLAICLNHLGLVYSRGLGRIDQGQAAMNRALGLCEMLGREHPDTIAYRLAQADILRNLARSKADASNFAGSVAIMEKELALREQLAQEDPAATIHQAALGNCLFGLSAMTGNIRQLERARECSSRSIAIFERLVRDHPDVPGYRDRLARVYVTRAGAITQMGDYGAGLTEMERGVAIAPGDGMTCYNGACGYANGSVAARRDTKLPNAERERLAERYASRSMELLRQAKQAGFFQALARVNSLSNDPDMAPLRERQDFKRFVQEVQSAPAASK
jgi:serine/threonine-protein kinase